MAPVISVADVQKHFRQLNRLPGVSGAIKSLFSRDYSLVKAVDGISFAIGQGEAVGYLGPNGAGKSTMIKMMTGILVPTSGRIEVLGRVPHQERTRNAREIGVVFGQRSQLWWDLPVIDSFDLHRRIYGIAERRYRDNLAAFSAMLELDAFLARPVRQLSLGQRMRCEIVMALLHEPRVVFLDEPTIGLDVVAKDAVRRFLAEVNRERGVTLILTTHDLQDIEQICPRLIMVDEGKLLFDGALANLRASLGASRRLRLEFERPPHGLSLDEARLISDEGPVHHYVIEREEVSLVQILAQIPQGLGLRDVKLEEPGIEEVIRTFYKQKPAAAAR